ncbi:snRNA-activating protein complex subunit 3-like [Babylonia areolata]|uniref:snRNA-activating protein complex subunit 3-like n=1 Tax=Babylonia areolata TaxID=304850 RepID=UPI003FD365D5
MAAPIEETAADTNSSSGTRAVINVRKFLESWDSDVTDLSLLPSDQKENQRIADRLGIGTDLVDELAAVCGADTLCCGDEPDDKADLLKMKGLPKNIDLTCVKYQERELERRRMVDYKLFVINKMKYRMMDVYRMVPDPSSLKREMIPDEKLVPHPNVVITVKVYRTRISTTFLPKGEVFEVLGTQTLTELKDAISCMKDDAIAGEFSSYPNLPNERLTPAKNIYKSGMFFIENVFYNDMREPDNRDYSAPILKWAVEKQHENLDLFRTAKMEDTLFMDLNIQLGVPYLYQHQGHCEHIIVFTDIRLLHCDDPQDVTLYPYLLSETVNKRTVCRSCQMDSARWVVYDSPLTPDSPCFLCHSCFTLLHYDSNGQKVCSFRAYMYRQKLSLH